MATTGELPTAIALMGPTASGKTELAVQLVRALPVEIVSVDSVMVYRGMDIGTAKPGPEVLAEAPHRLIDFLDPAEACSAARFAALAREAMAEITAAGRIPLLVGGTMLYFRALIHGLSRLPAADAALRARLAQEAHERGWAAMHARLAEVDPPAAERIHPNDPQRIQRALEVFELTGEPLSDLQQQNEPLPWQFVKLALIPPDRAVLHERIARRFARMLEQGLIEEVESLFVRGDLHEQMPSIRAVGYRQLWHYLQGRINYTQMQEQGVAATRQLAKRQLTWLRSEPAVRVFDALDQKREEQVLKWLRRLPIELE
ncbi:tRNA (adenosine(37)-N6)-dimethylallyltransferase MiaA [Thiohalophilus thiocyanatoxydans]|uniref:tRNA dimethylallyltransferase n=1 Tax=Thiohalophilus thiocyanatoxydans TaxID=381308 RepID=A0A4R8IPF7_9GAMM|nr:tRNA (adenosine(37)-N6)-dimethylallyltransferase MiaA [Thiohalophilus thiocyanatoxydans]TDX99278.1 tRNA dimethylallyltransferase [Thiohalophilus thiocyanatoxydans]